MSAYATDSMRHDGDITDDRTLRLTVPEAGEALGISAEAVRQRIKRRTLTPEKDIDGSVFVLLDADRLRHNVDNGQPNTDRTSDITLMQAHLDSMQEQVGYLKEALRARDEDLKRKDTIIMTMAQRIPELESASESRESPIKASDEQDNGARIALVTAPGCVAFLVSSGASRLAGFRVAYKGSE